MNKLYTCHQCKTEFDLVPSEPDVSGARLGREPRLHKGQVRVKCPGCYEAGYTGCPGSLNPSGKGDMIYTIDLKTMQPV